MSNPRAALKGAANARVTLLAGVTTVRNVGANGYTDIALRDAINDGDVPGPRVLASGPALGITGGHCDDNLVGEIQRENFRKAVKAGIKLTFGTDAGVYPHGDNPKQLAIMVRYGMTPMQALQAATLTGADAPGLKDKIGAIAPGHYADIIAVKSDPIADIRVLESLLLLGLVLIAWGLVHHRCVVATAKHVAEQLGNTPAVCRRSYINHVVFTAWRAGEIGKRVPRTAVAPRKLEKLALALLRAQARAAKRR